ncbi:MAG: AraC family transcriptional regulator [Burkholderiaceae bacterium]|nr:AraC family transcriptional regulator [Burkholderiaceae bacterium]
MPGPNASTAATAATAPTARLIAPPDALRACLYAALVRDTRPLGPALPPEQRLNRFPALPFCGITWILDGGATLLQPAGHPDLGPLPSCFVSGPQTAPFASLNHGPIHTFCLVLHPAALLPLCGVAAGSLRDRHRPLHELLPADGPALDQAVRAAPDDAARLAAATDWLLPRWQAAQAAQAALAPAERGLALLPELLRQATVQGVASLLGWTSRHLERRSRQVHGLSPRELRSIQRGHDAVIGDSATLPLADAALQHGYADQPHMSRDWRRLTGLSPARLRARLASDDESWWLYRLRRHGRP